METKHTTSAGGVVVNQERKVLVVSQQGGTSWSLPKGHIDEGEDALTAAKREIQEESGISQLALVRELESYQRFKIGKNGEDDMSEIKTMIFFIFQTEQQTLAPTDPANPEARWVGVEQVADILTHPKDKEFFANLVKSGLM